MKRFVMRIFVVTFLCCWILSFIGCGENITGPPGVSLYPCGIGDTIEVDKGTLSLDEVAVAKEISKGTETYKSGKQGFLVFKMRFDFEMYSLKTCGVWIYGSAPDYTDICLNYRHLEGREGMDCPIEEDGDFNLAVSTKLSADLHIKEAEGTVKGIVYLCFDLSSDVYEYLYERKYGELTDNLNSEGNSWSNISLYINDIRKTGITKVKIGGAFRLVSFTDRYVISE